MWHVKSPSQGTPYHPDSHQDPLLGVTSVMVLDTVLMIVVTSGDAPDIAVMNARVLAILQQGVPIGCANPLHLQAHGGITKLKGEGEEKEDILETTSEPANPHTAATTIIGLTLTQVIPVMVTAIPTLMTAMRDIPFLPMVTTLPLTYISREWTTQSGLLLTLQLKYQLYKLDYWTRSVVFLEVC